MSRSLVFPATTQYLQIILTSLYQRFPLVRYVVSNFGPFDVVVSEVTGTVIC